MDFNLVFCCFISRWATPKSICKKYTAENNSVIRFFIKDLGTGCWKTSGNDNGINNVTILTRNDVIDTWTKFGK